MRFTKLCILLLPFFLFSCEDKMEEHNKVPGWLRGSVWEVLKAETNYSIFLEGVELAGYRPIMEGKSILTVMAPDDTAFGNYLREQGYTSIKDMPDGELKKVIGFHLLYYSYQKARMENFRPEGDLATEESKVVGAGLFYKFRTRSADEVSTVTVNGRDVTIYHQERFLPVFSYNFFNTKGIDAKLNYEYFYPNSTWTGSDGFNVSNASVNTYEMIADNGYVYVVDRVLEPLETIYTEMKKREDFSQFLNLYDSYSVYEYESTLTEDYAAALGVDSLWLHRHGETLPPIAMEWPTPYYWSVTNLASVSYSVFAPSNQALNNFFEGFWKKGYYTSLGDIDPLVMKHLLNQYVHSGSVVFPDELATGKITNSYGVPFDFGLSNVSEKAMCVNGSFYGINVMKTPPLFASVVGPAFMYKTCSYYMYALDGSSMLNAFVSPDTEYIMLIPTNAQMQTNGYYLLSYTGSTGKELAVMSDEGGYVSVGTSTKQNMVNMHTVNSKEELKTSGTQVLGTQSSFNYWFVKDGKITTNALFNQILEPDYVGDPFVAFTKISNDGEEWSNGNAYFYDYQEGIFEVEATDGLMQALAVRNDRRYPYNSFTQLMKKAGMVSGNNIPVLLGTRFITFIPTNEAVAAALQADAIPGITGGSISTIDGSLNAIDVNVTELQEYLYSYFLRSSENAIMVYPYIGSTMRTGDYTTMNGKTLKYTDTGSSLNVQLEGGSLINVNSGYDYFPFAYDDGCFHLIDAIL